MRIGTARNWDEFLAALRLYQTPTFNFVYADVSGDIGYISPGLVPLRKSGDGLTPADGASGEMDWIGTIPFEQWPQLHNPAAGFAFNANNAILTDGRQPLFGQDWEEAFRARRIQQFFDTIDKHSLDTSAAMQADHVSLAAKELLPFLKGVTPSDERARQALALLAGWDGVMDKDRAEPLIFDAFMNALHQIMLVDKVGLSMSEKGPYAATTLISLLRDHPSWCEAPGKPDPDCRATLERALDQGLTLLVKRDGPDMSQWKWGHEHVALLQHKVYSHIPLLDRVSDLSMPSSGDFYTLDRGGGFEAPAGPAVRTHAGRRLSRRLRPFRSRQLALRDRHRRIRPYFLAPLSRSRPAVDRRQIDHARRERGRSEARGRAGTRLHAAIAPTWTAGAGFAARTVRKKSATTNQRIVVTL